MANLLQETKAMLEECGLAPADVCWVGSKDGSYVASWGRFALLADFTYDAGYGGQEIAQDLVVVGESWWLERHEYDGSEWWEHKELPAPRPNTTPMEKVRSNSGNSWVNMRDIHID